MFYSRILQQNKAFAQCILMWLAGCLASWASSSPAGVTSGARLWVATEALLRGQPRHAAMEDGGELWVAMGPLATGGVGGSEARLTSTSGHGGLGGRRRRRTKGMGDLNRRPWRRAKGCERPWGPWRWVDGHGGGRTTNFGGG
jgi:hypothetical protein